MIVKNIVFSNDKVEIILDKKSFYISRENYIEHPISINSNIEDEQVKLLLDYELVIEGKLELIKLLNRKALSEHEVYLKLKSRNIEDKYIKQIIQSLKRALLINDEFVASINLENMLLKRKGKIQIVKFLKEKKISDNIIDKVIYEIDEEVYINNFNKLIEKYSKMYEDKSYKVKKNLIKQKLQEYGYESALIDTLCIIDEPNKEYDLAKKAMMKIIKNKNVDLYSYENLNKLKRKLVVKGFSYDIINKVIEEVNSNETY